MQVIQERKKQKSIDGMQRFDEFIGKKPMHPDDFKAHLAWVTAKRFHEIVIESTFAEKPVRYHIIG
jgi:hypothetical protein